MAGRTAGPELPAPDALARGHDGPGGDHRAAFHDRLVHHHRAHADEAAVFQGAGVQQRHVADGDVVADVGRHAAAGLPVVALAILVAVNHGAVLDIGARADADAVDVGADDAAVPDGALGADLDIADDHRAVRDKGAFVDLWADAPKRLDDRGHGWSLLLGFS